MGQENSAFDLYGKTVLTPGPQLSCGGRDVDGDGLGVKGETRNSTKRNKGCGVDLLLF